VRAYAVLKKEAQEIPRPLRPKQLLTGAAAALEEYRYFKAAGILNVWWERWKFVLRPR
jgi:hypothetical protein